METRIIKGVQNLYAEGKSILDIAQKMNIKKHTVESILNGVYDKADTPIKKSETPTDTPTSRFQIPHADTLRVEKLERENEKLREKCEQLQEKVYEKDVLYGKQIAKLEAEVSILKSAESLKKQELQKLDVGNKERKKAVKTLQTKINEFLAIFVECEVEEEVRCEQDQADAYFAEIKKLRKQFLKLFGEYDYEKMLHYQALEMLQLNFDREFTVNFLRPSTNYYVFDEQEVSLLSTCLADGVELGDSEDTLESEQEY